MCNGFWNELKQWLKAFTLIEIILCVVEAVLLVLLVGIIVFLILHLMICPKRSDETEAITQFTPITSTVLTSSPKRATTSATTDYYDLITFPPEEECSWRPSQPTEARTRYYYSSTTPFETTTPTTTKALVPIADYPSELPHDIEDDASDGDEAAVELQDYVLALVKLKPPHEVTFGCMLTRVSRYWTLTAASCVRAAEELEPLDAFVLLERYGGERAGRAHSLAGAVLHPAHALPGYDLAALRSETALAGGAPPPRATLLDYFLVAPGDRFHVLGYGGFRSVRAGGAARRLRRAPVHAVAAAACRATTGGERHLGRGGAVRQEPCGGACGAVPMCAGPRFARGEPCNYCAGSPLLRGGTLYGLMSDSGHCGVSCEPELYVNIALVRDWIDGLLDQYD